MKNTMSMVNLLTHQIPILTFPSDSLSFHRRCSSHKLLHSGDFISAKNTTISRKGGSLMAERVIKISALGSGDGEETNIRVLEQEGLIDGSSQTGGSDLISNDFEATLNHLSKWLVAGLFGVVVLYRHDAEALWGGMGSILNSALSVILKRILNQERPVSNLRSDPGMPSSHAQSIFYTVMFIVLSMVELLGVNELTLTLGATSVLFGSYLSWLRVRQQLHTISQVAVGAVLGSCFSLLWLWSWDAVVFDAFNSFLWVRVSIVLGSAICGLGFLSYVVSNWFMNER